MDQSVYGSQPTSYLPGKPGPSMILVTGANGQIGVDLLNALSIQHGPEALLATDVRPPLADPPPVPFSVLDVTDESAIARVLDENDVTSIVHLAGILSATGQQYPDLCWSVNVTGLKHMLDAARSRGISLFWPSSIAAFGPTTPRVDTPQSTITEPGTMYGVTKVTGELLSKFYASHYDVDVRSVRFPGVISHAAPPGGGTTDWAVAMFFEAVSHSSYRCFVGPDTRMPMMYMPDAVKSVMDLIAADPTALTVRTSYNIASISFTPAELADAIRQWIPDFSISYAPDYRQQIADSWPESINDDEARRDWNWQPDFDLPAMVRDMLWNVAGRLGHRKLQERMSPD